MRRAALAAMVFAAGAVHAAQGDERVTAPLQLFAPPAPGTYALPPILAAPDGRVLDGRGRGGGRGGGKPPPPAPPPGGLKPSTA